MVKKMSQKTFTEKEMKLLTKNPYVKKVSDKSITYSDEFKELVVDKSMSQKHREWSLNKQDLILTS